MARMIDDHKSVQISVDEFVSANPEKIIKSLDAIFAVLESWDPVQELPLLCMIFEKVAFDNEMEATKLADMIRDLIHSVREEEGEYVWPEVEILRRDEKRKEERATGEWEFDGHHMRCKQCGVYMCTTDREGDPIPITYCPNCGRKMEG